MRHHDHGHAAAGELLHDAQHVAHELGVERARGLVEQHDVRVHGQGTGDGHALLLAAGQLGGPVVYALAQPHLLQLLLGNARGLLLVAVQHLLLRQHDVSLGREVREQVEVLEHHAHFGAHLVDVGLLRGDLGVLEEDAAARGLLQQVHAAQKRGLARAGRAQDHHHLAAADVQVDAAQHLVVAERLAQVLDADDGLVRSARLAGIRPADGCFVCLLAHDPHLLNG